MISYCIFLDELILLLDEREKFLAILDYFLFSCHALSLLFAADKDDCNSKNKNDIDYNDDSVEQFLPFMVS